MNRKKSRLKRYLLICTGVVAVLGVAAVAGTYVVLKYATQPLVDGTQLASGVVTTVVTDRTWPFAVPTWLNSTAPIAIAAYLFELEGAGVGLVDAGMDTEANAIRAALDRSGRSPADVRAIFLTHEHNDHRAGVRAFPGADVYVHKTHLERMRSWRGANATGATRALGDTERLDIFGTRVEVFSVPGHTRDSVAILVHGVLFLGDSGAATYNARFQPNTLLSAEPEQVVQSLRSLAEHLEPRENDIRHLAFGHQGSLDTLLPLLEWAWESK